MQKLRLWRHSGELFHLYEKVCKHFDNIFTMLPYGFVRLCFVFSLRKTLFLSLLVYFICICLYFLTMFTFYFRFHLYLFAFELIFNPRLHFFLMAYVFLERNINVASVWVAADLRTIVALNGRSPKWTNCIRCTFRSPLVCSVIARMAPALTAINGKGHRLPLFKSEFQCTGSSVPITIRSGCVH